MISSANLLTQQKSMEAYKLAPVPPCGGDIEYCCEYHRVVLYARGMEAQLARDRLSIAEMRNEKRLADIKIANMQQHTQEFAGSLLDRIEALERSVKTAELRVSVLDDRTRELVAAKTLLNLQEPKLHPIRIPSPIPSRPTRDSRAPLFTQNPKSKPEAFARRHQFPDALGIYME